MNWNIRKKFWEKAEAQKADNGFSVALDGRVLRTPAKALLVVPTKALACDIAAEWNAVEDQVDPSCMPMTRLANSAIDKVAHQKREVADMLAAYADSDLLCYRAQSPEALARRQEKAWDPYLNWAEEMFDARLVACAGVIHASQNPEALNRLAQPVHDLDFFQLTAFHELVTLTGSLILALALIHGFGPAESIWNDSRLDENWQIEHWGQDEWEEQQTVEKFAAFLSAAEFFRHASE